MSRADVVVIGAGCAGLSAAVRLADAGKRVAVLEGGPRLGGRASTFSPASTDERVDNGQHVLFGCYRDTYAFLARLGTAHLAPLDRRLNLTMAGADGRQRTLSCPSLPPPWHLVAGVMGWSALPIVDRLKTWKVAQALRRSDKNDEHEVVRGTVAEWLEAHGQTPDLCRWLWYPLALAALNQSPDVAVAAPFVRVLRDLFGARPDDSAIGLPIAPLDELFARPAAAFIEARGGFVRTNARAHLTVGSGRIVDVRAGDLAIEAPVVISAVPWHAFGDLWPSGCPDALRDVGVNAARMTASPIVTVNLWLDGPLMDRPFIGFVDRAMHWAFDKRRIFGAAASHISMVSSGASDLAEMENDAIVATALADLGLVYPAVGVRKVLRSIVVRERRATFSLAQGEPPRPAVVTKLPRFFLAGDWVDTGLPATIESAVKSGHAAADAALAALGPARE